MRLALERISGKDDMLPPREDDKVAGRIAGGFARGLAAKLASQVYRPEQALFVTVPKRGLSTRPAALVSLRDRVVFEALVERARAKIERRLLPVDTVLWPRGDETPSRFSDLDSKPVEMGGGYVIFGDVAGFYESILHSQLRVDLADAGVRQWDVDAIIDHLGAIMGADRGLPQGIVSSDSLATLYLARVDAFLSEMDVNFWRHGDDYRLWAESWPAAQWSAHTFESALRRSGLLANSKKLVAMLFANYVEKLNDLDSAADKFRADIEGARLWAIGNLSEDELSRLVEDLGIDDDIQWSYFYYNAMTLEELKKEIAPSLAPKAMEVIEEMFRNVASDSSTVPSELRHARLVFCLRRMAAAKSQAGVEYAARLLVNWPDETKDVCNYLLSVVKTSGPWVASAGQSALTTAHYMTDWQKAWILRVLSRCSLLLDPATLDRFQKEIQLASTGWLVRIEIARVLASRGELSRPVATSLSAHCGGALRADLIGVIAANEQRLPWARSFLNGVTATDDLARVVVSAVSVKSGG